MSQGHQYELELLTYPCCESLRTDYLRDSLNDHIVDELQSLIYEYVRSDCYGCQVDHPSQVQHVLCLYSSTEEWTELYIEKALQMLDSYKVMEKWYPHIRTLTNEEKGDARRLWNHFNTQRTRYQADLPRHWVSLWSERVKRQWNYGDK